ncbi:hypothetical protein [Staphylococcus massiliensis]|uniref:hypothetical protein n=1 Tax=Staphylococcus massiliensis TaxID=555791 RepID=UPI001EDF1597|nr:hypothetical protein [Staphylococcus massiliensis]MCG3399211.1 hypothetical protein [Staphylococcus massiliensis]
MKKVAKYSISSVILGSALVLGVNTDASAAEKVDDVQAVDTAEQAVKQTTGQNLKDDYRYLSIEEKGHYYKLRTVYKYGAGKDRMYKVYKNGRVKEGTMPLGKDDWVFQTIGKVQPGQNEYKINLNESERKAFDPPQRRLDVVYNLHVLRDQKNVGIITDHQYYLLASNILNSRLNGYQADQDVLDHEHEDSFYQG